jgi:hypothetical protein
MSLKSQTFTPLLDSTFAIKLPSPEKTPIAPFIWQFRLLSTTPLFKEVLIQDVLKEYPAKLLVYNLSNQEIQSWIG